MKRLFLLSLLFTAAAQVQSAPTQQGVESESVELTLDAAGNGTAIARKCEACPVKAIVDSETEFKAGKKNISAAQAKSYSGKAGTLLLDTASHKALLVHYWK